MEDNDDNDDDYEEHGNDQNGKTRIRFIWEMAERVPNLMVEKCAMVKEYLL